VEKGGISFEPSAAAGMDAPTVYHPIEQGQYSIPRGKGPGAGKYTVIVVGWDPSKEYKDEDGVTHYEPLFPEYRFEVTFPVPNNTLDIEVPAEGSGAAQ
jgi:hypothetical protein